MAINQNIPTNDDSRRKLFHTIKDAESQNKILTFTVVNKKDKYLQNRELTLIFIMLEWAWRFKGIHVTTYELEDICAVAGVSLCKYTHGNSPQGEKVRVSSELLEQIRKNIRKQNDQLLEPIIHRSRTIGFKIEPEKLKDILQRGIRNNESLSVSAWDCGIRSGNQQRKKEKKQISYSEILSLYNDLEAKINNQPINANQLSSHSNANDSTIQIITTLQKTVLKQPPAIIFQEQTQITPTIPTSLTASTTRQNQTTDKQSSKRHACLDGETDENTLIGEGKDEDTLLPFTKRTKNANGEDSLYTHQQTTTHLSEERFEETEDIEFCNSVFTNKIG